MARSLPYLGSYHHRQTGLQSQVGLLRRVRNAFPQHTLNLLYKSLIVSRFDYYDFCLGNVCKTVLFFKLDNLWNVADKIILAFLVGILLSYCSTPLAGKNSMIAFPITWMSWSTKLNDLCNIFNHFHETHSHLTRSSYQSYLVPPRCKNNSEKNFF